MFPVFHLAWSTWPATKTFVAGWRKLLRKVELGSTLSNKFWFCCSFFIKLTTCRATNLLVPEAINQSVRCISSTRNKRFCCGSSWLRQVKNEKHRPKLATKQCCATSWGFLYLVFRRLYLECQSFRQQVSSPTTSSPTYEVVFPTSNVSSPMLIYQLLQEPTSKIRARTFLSNSLVPSDKYNVYFACPNHKTTCPKIGNHNNTKG